MRTMIVIVATLLVAGCDSYVFQSQYQLHTAPDGKIYRLNQKSGEIHLVTPDGLIRLSDGYVTLTKGSYYKLEDGKFLKYLGDGKFEKNDYAIRQVN